MTKLNKVARWVDLFVSFFVPYLSICFSALGTGKLDQGQMRRDISLVKKSILEV